MSSEASARPENSASSSGTALVRRHAGNALALAMAGALSKVLMFGATVLIIRELSLEHNGAFQLAGSFGFLFAVVTELGVRGLMLRQLARVRDDSAAARHVFAQALNVRLTAALVLFPFLALTLRLTGYEPQIVSVSLWFACYAVLDSAAILLKFAFRAYERMKVDAVSSLAGRALLVAGIVLLAALDHLSLASILAVHIGAALAECLGLAFYLKATLPLRLWNTFEPGEMWDMLIRSIPFATVVVLALLYLQTGAIVLSLFRGEEAVALLKTAAKLPEAALFLPTALVNAILPFLSRQKTSPPTVQKYLNFLVRYLGIAGIAGGAVFVFEPEWLIRTLFKPEYLEAAPAFRLFGLWMPLIFVQYVFLNMLFCLDQEKVIMRRYVGIVVLNLGLNLILVPRYGVAGAAVSLLVSELAGVSIELLALAKRGVFVKWSSFVQLAGLAALCTVIWAGTVGLPEAGRITALLAGSGMYAAGCGWFTDREFLRQLAGRRRASGQGTD